MARLIRLAAMRRRALVIVGSVLLLAGCGSGTLVSPVPQTVQGALPKAPVASAASGKKLYKSLGCNACHSLNGTKSVGPTFMGLAGSPVKLDNGQTVTADDAYLIDSIVDPDRQIVAGYKKGIMSAVIKPGSVSQTDAASIVAFIKTIK